MFPYYTTTLYSEATPPTNNEMRCATWAHLIVESFQHCVAGHSARNLRDQLDPDRALEIAKRFRDDQESVWSAYHVLAVVHVEVGLQLENRKTIAQA